VDARSGAAEVRGRFLADADGCSVRRDAVDDSLMNAERQRLRTLRATVVPGVENVDVAAALARIWSSTRRMWNRSAWPSTAGALMLHGALGWPRRTATLALNEERVGEESAFSDKELRGKTLGIAGLGRNRSGSRAGVRSFGMRESRDQYIRRRFASGAGRAWRSIRRVRG